MKKKLFAPLKVDTKSCASILWVHLCNIPANSRVAKVRQNKIALQQSYRPLRRKYMKSWCTPLIDLILNSHDCKHENLAIAGIAAIPVCEIEVVYLYVSKIQQNFKILKITVNRLWCFMDLEINAWILMQIVEAAFKRTIICPELPH